MNQLNVIRIDSPFNPSAHTREVLNFKSGQSIAELIPEPIGAALPWAITMNGKVIDQQDRAMTFPSDGDYVTVCPVPAGGGDDDGKSIIRIVAMIAVIYFSNGTYGYELGMSAATATGVGTAAGWQAAMAVAGSMLVNALLPPGQAARQKSESPTYGIDGAKNTSAEGVPVPICYGTFRMAGNIISNYVINDGDSQILYMLINAGEGPVAALTSPQINEQPIENFKDWEILSPPRLGTSNQQPVDWFSSAIIPVSVGQEFTQAWKTVTIGTPGTDVYDRVRVDIVAPGGLVEMIEGGQSIHGVTVVLEFQYRAAGSGGAWLPLLFTNETTGQVQEDYFTPPFDPLGYAGEIFCDENNVLYIMLEYETEGGFQTSRQNVGMRYSAGQHNNAGILSINASQRNPYRRSLISPPLAQGAYEFRYRRTNDPAPNTQTTKTDNIYISDINKMINEKVAFRDTALFGLKVRLSDQLNGLPNVTYINGGKLIKVYNNNTKQWTVAASANPAWICWDILTNKRYGGGCAEARLDFYKWVDWADWCVEEGLEYHGVIDSQMNVWDAVSQVSRAGRGQILQVGTRYSVVIERPDVPTQLFSVANMIAGTFKETWTGMSDRANEIEVTFSDKEDNYKERTIRLYDSNAIAAGLPQRVARVETRGIVTSERAYREAALMLNINRWIQRSVEFGTSLDAIACRPGDLINVQHDMPQWGLGGRFEAGSTTSLLRLDRSVLMKGGTAYQALIHSDSVVRQTRTVNAVASNNIILTGYAGETNVKRILINGVDHEIQDIVQMGALWGVKVPNAAGVTAGMSAQLIDTNVMTTVGVVNPYSVGQEGEVTSITLASPLATAPPQYDKWLFGPTNKVVKPFRVTRISGSHEYRRDITAIEYYPEVYEDSVTGVPPDYSGLSGTILSHVTLDPVTEMVKIAGGATLIEVTISFRSLQQIYANADVWISRNGGAEILEKTGKSFVTVNAVKGEVLKFRVVARSVTGAMADFNTAPTVTYTVFGNTVVPPDVTGLLVSVGQTGLKISWDRWDSPISGDTEIREGANWDTGTMIFRGKATTYTVPSPDPDNYTYWVKHHDSAGILESANATTSSVYWSGSSLLSILTVSATSQFFKVSPAGATTPGTITVTANGQNMSGTPVFTVTSGTITGTTAGVIPGSGNSRTIAFGQMTTDMVTISVAWGGQTDTISLFRLFDGTDGITGWLTNESHTLPSNNTGTIVDYTGCGGTMRIYKGATQLTSATSPSVSFAIVGYTGFAAPAYSAPGTFQNGGSITVNGSTGVYAVTGNMSPTADTGTVTLRATLSTGQTFDRIFSIAKAKAGAPGAAGSDAVSAVLSSESHAIPCTWYGAIISLAGAVTTMYVLKGTVDDSVNWTFSKVDSGVTSTLSGNTVSITSISGNVGYVDITASRFGYPSITKRFSLTKDLQGTRGTVQVSRAISGSSWSNSEANAAIVAAGYVDPINRDMVTLYNTLANYSETRFWDGTTWVSIAQYLNGNLFVDGTIAGNKLIAGSITGDKIQAGSITAAQIQAGALTVANASITTLKLAGNAVTVPSGTSAGGYQSHPGESYYAFSGWTNVANGDGTYGKVIVWISVKWLPIYYETQSTQGEYPLTVRIQRHNESTQWIGSDLVATDLYGGSYSHMLVLDNVGVLDRYWVLSVQGNAYIQTGSIVVVGAKR